MYCTFIYFTIIFNDTVSTDIIQIIHTLNISHNILQQHVHVLQQDREYVIRSKRRSQYDIIDFESIKRHVNIHEDPSTGHMIQTLQIV